MMVKNIKRNLSKENQIKRNLSKENQIKRNP
jgi:hypothetical protein